MLILTNTFGPLITITINMLRDLFIFFILFMIELTAFSCVGILSFGNLQDYNNVSVTLVMFFQSALGDWDLSIYDDAGSDAKKWYGIIFHIFVIAVNMLLLVNLVIAIMSDTYRYFAEIKLGLFSQGIIEAIPSYRNNKRFGALISATPPFNLLTMFCLPIMLCIKDPQKQEAFNMFVSKCIYFPVCFILTLVFTICNLLLVPFAFVKAFSHKIILYRNAKGTGSLISLILFFFFGIPLLLLTVITDIYWFVKHGYKWDMQRVQESQKYPQISLRAFNKFYNMVNKLPGDKYNAKKLVLEVNETFKIPECIFGVLYTNR